MVVRANCQRDRMTTGSIIYSPNVVLNLLLVEQKKKAKDVFGLCVFLLSWIFLVL